MTAKDQARELMGRIRYQVFAPEVTTVGPCPRCGATSRGSGICADCLAKDLAVIAGGHAAEAYLDACKRQRDAESRVLAIAGFKP